MVSRTITVDVDELRQVVLDASKAADAIALAARRAEAPQYSRDEELREAAFLARARARQHRWDIDRLQLSHPELRP